MGFRPGAFAPFAEALAAPAEPLTLAELRGSPLGPLVSTLVLDLDGRTAVITYLRGVRDPELVRAALEDLADVHFFEQRTFINEIAAPFRDRTLLQLVVGGVCVLLMLVVRYRRWRHAFAAFLPALLTALLLLFVLRALGDRRTCSTQ